MAETTTTRRSRSLAPATNPAIEDVAISQCTTDDAGWMVAEGTVTNNSSEASTYTITVVFESKDGATQLATGNAFIDSLEPGQNAPLEANSLTEPSDEFTCRLSEVNRFAS